MYMFLSRCVVFANHYGSMPFVERYLTDAATGTK